MSELARKIQKVLDDPLLKDFQSEDFSATDYISRVSGQGEVKGLVDVFFSLAEKEKAINECLGVLAATDKDFFEKQFAIPKKYGVK